MKLNSIKGLSLFANVGIGECLLHETNVEIVVANELLEDRGNFYSHVYKDTDLIVGDIRNDDIFNEIIKKSKEKEVQLIIATPPCQGMSTAGKKSDTDVRNDLVKYAVKAIKEISPDFVMLENVVEQLTTKIEYKEAKKEIYHYLIEELGDQYYFSKENIVNTQDYGIPQSRERAIILLTKITKKSVWQLPNKEEEIVTLEDSIGMLPSLDPLIYDIPYDEHLTIFPDYEKKKVKGEKVSKWHTPPKHVYRQVYALMHTPTGKSAFENPDRYKPLKKDGSIVRGYNNTYKRQNWDKPGYTVTMYNRTISSQNNVHPGRFLRNTSEGMSIYSDPRVLTIYEIMLIMTIPEDWDVPDWATDSFIRSVIGEGIPPLLVKKIMEVLPNET